MEPGSATAVSTVAAAVSSAVYTAYSTASVTVVPAAAPAEAPVKAPFELTPKYALKWTVAVTLFGGAMHYLVTGREEGDWGKIVTGAVLALASLLFL